jgi:UDP-glucose 4-epimerase
MRVLVIGGAGYIGARLVSELRERGVDTVSADLRRGDGIDDELDMRSAGELYRLLVRRRPDIVVVTAYMLSRPSVANPLRAVETNVLGLTHVFQAAADFGLQRVVFTAAGAIYGHNSDFPNQPVDETVHCRPRSLYGKMKQFNEWMAEHYNNTAGTEIVSLRISGPHGVVGPHGTGKNTGGASTGGNSPYDLVVASAGTMSHLTLPWAPKTLFRFIHVEDAAAAFIPILLAPKLEHRVYNAPGFAISMTELAATAEPICNFTVDWTDPGQSIDYVARIDSTRYEHEFGFRPRPMADWMREEVASKLAAGRSK